MIKASEFSTFKNKPLVMATGYDFPFAAILEAAGVDVILVGDSLANVVLGLNSTRDINMEIMSIFVAAVTRGAKDTHILADMPFGSDENATDAVTNGRHFLELGAHSVKIEGLKLDSIKALTSEGIPVIGHLGLLPQTAQSFKKVGLSQVEKDQILRGGDLLSQAGVIGVVLEHMDFELAGEVTQRLPIPTIGIGAGKKVNGQVLVLHDLLGLSSGYLPPFAKSFAHLGDSALAGARDYCAAVRQFKFP